MGTPMKHTKITKELDALHDEVMVMGLKEDNIHEQIVKVNTRLVMVKSLEKQLDIVEVLVEKKTKMRTNIWSDYTSRHTQQETPKTTNK